MLHKEPRIVFLVLPPNVECSVHPDEARILEEWLATTRNLTARSLKGRIVEALEASEPPVIDLDQHDRETLLELLKGTELGEHEGLRRLRNTLLGELLSEDWPP